MNYMTDGDLVWRTRATFWDGLRAVGGSLELTTENLSFKPQVLERALGGRAQFVIQLGQVNSVEVKRGGFPRRRLYISFGDSLRAILLVPDAEKRAADIRRCVALSQT